MYTETFEVFPVFKNTTGVIVLMSTVWSWCSPMDVFSETVLSCKLVERQWAKESDGFSI